MGNKTIDFSYRVRGDFSPNGLQKVFFSFYPKDTAQMEKIANDILDISDCAIWFHTDSLTEDDDLIKFLEIISSVIVNSDGSFSLRLKDGTEIGNKEVDDASSEKDCNKD